MPVFSKPAVIAFGIAALALGPLDAAACPSEEVVEAFVSAWTAKTPVSPPFGTDLSKVDASCAQDMVVAKLADSLGAPVGYKVVVDGDQAIVGVLLQGMILDSSTDITPAYGAKPVYSVGIAFVVGDPAINNAGTPQEALQAISAIRPYIDLGDGVLKDPAAASPAVVTSIDAGARYAVLGGETPIDTGPAGVTALASMDVVITDGTGKTLATEPGSAVMGNPLNALLVALAELQSRGGKLREGDVVAVGPYAAPAAPVPGLIVTAGYNGLQGNPTVTVTFNDE